MYIDCFLRNIDDAEMEQIYSDHREYFVNQPVPLYMDNGTVTVQLGFHVKTIPSFYAFASGLYNNVVYLYQELPANFRINDKFPMHVFGPGNGIDTAIDPDDADTFCRFEQGQEYAIRHDRAAAYKIHNGQGLVELTQEELDEFGIVLETEE